MSTFRGPWAWGGLVGCVLASVGCAADAPSTKEVARVTQPLGSQRYAWRERNLPGPSSSVAGCVVDAARSALVCVSSEEEPGTWSMPLSSAASPRWDRHPGAAPGGTYLHFALVDFPPHARSIAFTSGSGVLVPWEWDGESWKDFRREDAPLSIAQNFASAYDAERKQIVLFGGGAQHAWSARTLTWDGDAWHVGPNGPADLAWPTAAYDEISKRVIVFGTPAPAAADAGAPDVRTTWAWDGVSWTALPGTSPDPAPRLGSARLAFDPARHALVLLGLVDVAHDGQNPSLDGVAVAWDRQGDSWVERVRAPLGPMALDVSVDPENHQLLIDRGAYTLDANGFSPVRAPHPSGGAFQAVADVDREQLVLVGPQAGSVLSWSWSESAGWMRKANAAIGTTRYSSGDSGATYDAANHRVVYYTYSSTFGEPNGTVFFDGTTWSAAPIQPVYGSRPRLAYDSTRQRALLYGAYNTFLYQLGAGDLWTVVNTPSYPKPPGQFFLNAGFTYDPVNSRALLYGTYSSGPPNPQLWSLSGAPGSEAWTQLTWAGAPGSTSSQPAFVYDVYDSMVLMAGGGLQYAVSSTGASWQPSANPIRGDATGASLGSSDGAFVWDLAAETLWSWKSVPYGGLWTRRSPNPGPGDPFAGGYDQERKRLVVLARAGSTQPFGTWEWDGARWSDMHPASAPIWEPNHSSLTYDSDRKVMLFFGQTGTWSWNGATWTQESLTASSDFAPVIYDRTRQRALAVAWNADGSQHLLQYRGAGSDAGVDGWLDLGAAPLARRVLHAAAYDAARDRLVVFGGADDNYDALGDTWEWDGSTWLQVALDGPSPPPRAEGSATYDAKLGVLLHGGHTLGPSQELLSDLWSWDGTHWKLLSTDGEVAHSSLVSHDINGPVLVPLVVNRTGTVLSLQSRGGACHIDADCIESFCTDGVCCNSRACGTCETCNGTDPGACTSVLNTEDPDSCPASSAQACDAVGTCRAGLGAPCTTSASCGVGACADGVCCDSACTGTCQSCRASDNVAEREGICAPVKEGQDPRNACEDQGAASCGYDGTCDGKGTCKLYAAAVCGELTCDGDFTLTAPGRPAVSCAPYRCSGTTCNQRCTSVADCSDGFVCDATGGCVATQADLATSSESCGCYVVGRCSDRSRSGLGVLLAALLYRRSRRAQRRRLLQRVTGASER